MAVFFTDVVPRMMLGSLMMFIPLFHTLLATNEFKKNYPSSAN